MGAILIDPEHRLVTEVVVAILINKNQEVVLAKRPKGKPYAGYWEFPGGKVEAGETLLAATQRELHEELGIDVLGGEKIQEIEFDYPHAFVRLHVFWLDQQQNHWRGEARGVEGQTIVWSGIPILLEPMLPASVDIVTAIEKRLGKEG